jgi:hypothetical protein
VTDDDGAVIGVYVSTKDITEAKRIETKKKVFYINSMKGLKS